MNTYDLCEELNRELTTDDILVVGCSSMASPIFKKHYHGAARLIYSNYAQGAMGATIPVSIACSLASGTTRTTPDGKSEYIEYRRVVCVDGEGSFMQCIAELEVVHRMSLNITFFVINNGGYASIHNSEMRWFGRISEGATFPNVQLIARAYGLYSAPGDGFGFIEDCLHKWRGPQVIEVCVPHDEVPPPKEG